MKYTIQELKDLPLNKLEELSQDLRQMQKKVDAVLKVRRYEATE